MGPAPPEKTGKHRYVFLLYKNENSKKLEGPSRRKKWGNDDYRKGARQWSDKYGLSLVGRIPRIFPDWVTFLTDLVLCYLQVRTSSLLRIRSSET